MKYRSHPGDTKRVSLYLPTDVVQAVKALAVADDVSFSSTLLRLVEAGLEKPVP